MQRARLALTAELHGEGRHDRQEGGCDGTRREPSGAGFAQQATADDEGEEPGQGQRRNEPQKMLHSGQPFIIDRSSALAPVRRRMMATMIPRPTTTSAAATTITKNTIT